jgi:hypothetical protein
MNKGDKVELTGTDIRGTIIEIHPNFEASGETAASVEIDKRFLETADKHETDKYCYLDPVEVVDVKLLKKL